MGQEKAKPPAVLEAEAGERAPGLLQSECESLSLWLERVSFLGQPLESTCLCPILFKGYFSRVILKTFAAVRQVLSNSFLGRGTSWAWRVEDVGRFDREGKLRAGGLAAGGTLSALWSISWTRWGCTSPLALDESSIQGAFLDH